MRETTLHAASAARAAHTAHGPPERRAERSVDRRRFRELYREQYAFVWHTLRRFGVAAPHLDDVVQETFIVAYRRRDDFVRGSARSWLYGISRRVASNHRRSSRRMERKQQAITVDRAPWTSVPEATVALHALDAFLKTLSPVDREVFVLSEVEGLTGPELSQATGRKMATLYSRVRTLRQRFIDFSDEEPIDLDDVREQRPRATMQGWIALLPALDGVKGAATTAGATANVGTSTTVGFTWPAWATTTAGGVGIGTVLGTVVVAGLALTSRMGAATPPERPEPVPAVASATASAATPSSATPPAPSPSSESTRASSIATTTEPRSERRALDASAPRSTTADTPPPFASASNLARENALLLEAKQALGAGDPAKALRLTDEHQRSFNGSIQADLSIALRIEALCALGRTAQARGEAALLLRARPQSPVAEKVKTICSSAVIEPAAVGHGG